MPTATRTWTAPRVLAELRRLGTKKTRAGMARYGIPAANACGVPVARLWELARRIGKDHGLALALWETGVYEARMVATRVASAEQLRARDVERLLRSFDSWAITDTCCWNLLEQLPDAYALALHWSRRAPEFEKRAGYALMASLALHDKAAKDSAFTPFLTRLRRSGDDQRNFVRKAVSWALRAIGKRNPALRARAIATAAAIGDCWAARDALLELRRR